jgi:tetratricopeptide (TPR) repeat protein/5-methylcytosine-specific restriction endonuclease McrA
LSRDELSEDRVFEPEEAAHFLGITPELLFAYVRNAPKKALGHTRRLPSHQSRGKTTFRQKDLEEFDQYLKEPWSESAADRPPIPRYILDYLGTECGGQCARCGKGFKLETAHIEDYSLSLSHHHNNLIRLCSHCHDEFDSKKISSFANIRTIKDRLIAQVRERIARNQKLFGVSTRLPTPAPGFVGRKEELRDLKEALGQSRTICIRGPAGIGKSELLIKALNDLHNDREVLWLDISALSEVSDLEIHLANALRKPITAQAQSEIGSLLDNAPHCVVFDGIEAITPAKLESLEDWLSQLIRFTRTTVIVFTSQTPLLSVSIEADFELGPLNLEDSVALIRKNGRSTTFGQQDVKPSVTIDEPTSELVKFCDGHALTLKIVSGLLRFFSGPSEVLERIQRVGAAALENPTRKTQTKSTSLTVALTVAYSSLGDQERRLVYMISQCPAGCMGWSLTSFHVADAQLAIATLRRWHILKVESYGAVERLFLLSPIRTFVEESYERDQSTLANDALLIVADELSVLALVLCHKYIQGGDIVYGVARFDQEFANFIHIFYKAHAHTDQNEGYLRCVGSLATSMQVFCFVSGFWHRGSEIMRIGAGASLRLGMASSASGLLLHSMVLSRRAGNCPIEQLQKTVNQIVELAQTENTAHLLGNASMAMGELALISGQLDEAYDHFTTACEHYKLGVSEGSAEPNAAQMKPRLDENSIKSDDNHMLSMALMQQGFVREQTNRPSDALIAYREALELMERDGDMLNLGSVLHQIGNCNCYLKDHNGALNAYVKAATIFSTIGVREYLTNSVSEIGNLFIEHELDVDVARLLTNDTLEACIPDLLAAVSTAFVRSTPVQFDERACLGGLRKLFGLISVFSYIPNRELLQNLAKGLREKVLAPLIHRRISYSQLPLSSYDGLIMYLDVMTALCGSICAGEPKHRRSPKALLTEIEHLAWLCYDLSDFASDPFRVFDWLAMYIRRVYKINNITAGGLLVAIEATVLNNKRFTLNISPVE